MLNPTAKIAKSNGVDLPILTVYLAGRIAGDCIDKCLAWRKQIVNHYKNYKYDEHGNSVSYPISFLDALNSKESDSVDSKGLTSSIPPNLIYDKDILSVEHADVIVANMQDYFEEGLDIPEYGNSINLNNYSKEELYQRITFLEEKILSRRENLGTPMELSIALYLRKPTILIVPERRKEIFEKHPFTRRASVIVTSVEELLKKKWLQILYKSIAGSTGEY